MQYWESYSDLAVSIKPSDSEIHLDMNGAHMRPWHCMGMAQNQAFGTESVKLFLAPCLQVDSVSELI